MMTSTNFKMIVKIYPGKRIFSKQKKIKKNPTLKPEKNSGFEKIKIV